MELKVSFRNLDRSDVVTEEVKDRLLLLMEKFPFLKSSHVDITLAKKSSRKSGLPDQFGVKLLVRGGIYDSIIITKSSSNLFKSLAEVCDNALERLNRHGDKKRVRERNKARKMEKVLRNKIERNLWRESA